MKVVRQRRAHKEPVVAEVLGFNETHVLFHLNVGKRPQQRFMSRPIGPFMEDYGLV